MLKLRRAIVVEIDRADAGAGRAGDGRAPAPSSGSWSSSPATRAPGSGARRSPTSGSWARAEVGDEVIVNVQALDLGLGSGGFDVVHVNLTRGLDGDGRRSRARARDEAQLHEPPARGRAGRGRARCELPLGRPVAVLALHGQLAAVAWAFAQAAPGRAARLRADRGRRAARAGTRAPCACCASAACWPATSRRARPSAARARRSRTAGALHHGLRDARLGRGGVRPGPGIVGSGSRARPRRHGRRSTRRTSRSRSAARRCSSRACPPAIERARHRGISHHTLTVLDLLLEPVTVALPAGMRSPVGADLRARPGRGLRRARCASRPALALDVRAPGAHHPPRLAPRARSTCRRTPPAACRPRRWAAGWPQDPLFFGAALAGGERARGARAAERRCGRGVRTRVSAEPARRAWRGAVRGARRRDRLSRAPGRRAHRALPPRRRRGGLARDRAPPGAVGDRRPRRASRCGSCASRARRSASPTCWRSRRGAWTSTARRRCRPPSASSPRRSAAARAAGSRSSPTTRAPASPTSACTCSAPPTCTRRTRDSGEDERIEIVPWPLAGPASGAIAECRDAKTLIGLLWLARRLNA